MAKTITFEIDAVEARQPEAGVKELISQMQQANDRMDARQIEIDRLRSETQVMPDNLRQMQARL